MTKIRGKVREGLEFISTRFPHRSEIISVYSVAVFLCFSWTILGFLNKLSSFILYFTIAEIADIFVFMMAFALLESLASTALIVLLSMVLPRGWLREEFSLRGSALLVLLALASIVSQKLLQDDFPQTIWMVTGLAVPLVLFATLVVFIRRFTKLQQLLFTIQDRISIMLFIYLPLGFVSLFVWIYRNLL
jgi:hypothetical protein